MTGRCRIRVVGPAGKEYTETRHPGLARATTLGLLEMFFVPMVEGRWVRGFHHSLGISGINGTANCLADGAHSFGGGGGGGFAGGPQTSGALVDTTAEQHISRDLTSGESRDRVKFLEVLEEDLAILLLVLRSGREVKRSGGKIIDLEEKSRDLVEKSSDLGREIKRSGREITRSGRASILILANLQSPKQMNFAARLLYAAIDTLREEDVPSDLAEGPVP
ncbi:hypothetical protein Scep_026224 [Stephania cephalantha]|uniref:Uncharacterized protein n=1 Tax=Stephania cephalantha TaxID=152367 RepID=A0AAP0HT48_9MAGN